MLGFILCYNVNVANLKNLPAIQQTMFTEVKFYINPGHPGKLNTILIDVRPINT